SRVPVGATLCRAAGTDRGAAAPGGGGRAMAVSVGVVVAIVRGLPYLIRGLKRVGGPPDAPGSPYPEHKKERRRYHARIYLGTGAREGAGAGGAHASGGSRRPARGGVFRGSCRRIRAFRRATADGRLHGAARADGDGDALNHISIGDYSPA